MNPVIPSHDLSPHVDFNRIEATCGAQYRRENAALRAQVHDLSELLAAFELCDIEDEHLKSVRDRAFQRDITPDIKVTGCNRGDCQLQQETQRRGLSGGISDYRTASEDLGKVGCFRCTSEGEIHSLQLRVEVLERELANLDLRHNLLLTTIQRSQLLATVHGNRRAEDNASRDQNGCKTVKKDNEKKTETF
ncbi:uncharacterized protein PHALS_01502 [Plasmopara halstedii]|uniref:Uncharacterized protein n=1 Tax=Plasmopara halstedii TaxID=4781 RepID=A0A0N7L6T7_PLAHL|nr:uncharacterized protein PHALS_01502 [Plasmopara halstedii]CEG45187.1 hypothetical protein PHALS_01502 [Plasmopara halstedii]|eukprot:XP_024581556.1 hypothetical protein PHALS_01502 [Plasmopara halstedii]